MKHFLIGLFLLISLILFSFICIKNLDKIIPILPNFATQKLTDIIIQNYIPDEYDKEESKIISEYLNELVDNNNYKIFVIKNDTLNVISIQRNIIICSKITENLSKNEVQFLLAHELGHLNNDNQLKNLGSLFSNGFFTTIKDVSFSNDIHVSLMKNIHLNYLENEELKADLFALELFKNKGIDIKNSLSFIKKMEEIKATSNNFIYLSTHQNYKGRFNQINKYIANEKIIKLKEK